MGSLNESEKNDPKPRGLDPFLVVGVILLAIAGFGWVSLTRFRLLESSPRLALVIGGVIILGGVAGSVCCFLGLGRSR